MSFYRHHSTLLLFTMGSLLQFSSVYKILTFYYKIYGLLLAAFGNLILADPKYSSIREKGCTRRPKARAEGRVE